MRRVVFAAVCAVVLAGSSAGAHHGYAAFFDPRERTVAIEGQLEALSYRNPHVVMRIRGADSIEYTITWASTTQLRQQVGFTHSTFRIGDRLSIIGAPARDPRSHEVTRIRVVRRLSDQWIWDSGAPFARPS